MDPNSLHESYPASFSAEQDSPATLLTNIINARFGEMFRGDTKLGFQSDEFEQKLQLNPVGLPSYNGNKIKALSITRPCPGEDTIPLKDRGYIVNVEEELNASISWLTEYVVDVDSNIIIGNERLFFLRSDRDVAQMIAANAGHVGPRSKYEVDAQNANEIRGLVTFAKFLPEPKL